LEQGASPPGRPLAELQAVRAAQARLRPAPPDDGREEREDADALVGELMQAAQRLRDQAAPEATSLPLAVEEGQALGEESIAEEPAAEQPVGEQPAAEQPAAEQPAAEEPAAEPPVAQRPAGEGPVDEPPAAERVEEPSAAPPEPSGDPAPPAPEPEHGGFMRRLFHRRG
jgi:hypothetical protein